MRVWHSAWSWLKEILAADSVAGNTLTGMLTRLTLRNPFHVGRAAICELYRFLPSRGTAERRLDRVFLVPGPQIQSGASDVQRLVPNPVPQDAACLAVQMTGHLQF